MRNRNYYDGTGRFRGHNPRSRMVFGIMLALVGLGLMLKTMGLLPYIDFEDSWPVILIVIGILLGVKNSGRNNAWWILIVIGAANMIPQFTIMGKPSSHFVWPLVLIAAGVMMALRPKKNRYDCFPASPVNSSVTTDNMLNIDVTFGGHKEVVTSKDFKGGVVSVTFGGVELNLTQADFAAPSIVLDFKVSFSGVEMVVPSHWDIQNEISPSFGNVEDERTIRTGGNNETKKVLILRGNCSFGNIEIKSY